MRIDGGDAATWAGVVAAVGLSLWSRWWPKRRGPAWRIESAGKDRFVLTNVGERTARGVELTGNPLVRLEQAGPWSAIDPECSEAFLAFIDTSIRMRYAEEERPPLPAIEVRCARRHRWSQPGSQRIFLAEPIEDSRPRTLPAASSPPSNPRSDRRRKSDIEKAVKKATDDIARGGW